METTAPNPAATPPKTGKYSLNYGLILGGISVVFGIMLYVLDAHYSQDITNTIISLLITGGVIFWAVYEYRKANGGYLKLGEALKIGAGTALVSGILVVIWQVVLVEFLDPEFPAKVIDMRMTEAVAEGKLTTEQAAQQREMSIEYFWMGYPVMLIFSVIIGLVFGLIAGLSFKRSKPAY